MQSFSSKSFSFVISAVCLCILFSCNNKKKILDSPEGYDLNEPVIVKLPVMLGEISGVQYYPADTAVFAIEDERGQLYKIYYKRDLGLQHWKFGPDGDYEDICLVDSTFYVLKSEGSIVAFKFENMDTLRTTEFKTNIADSEFESLYYNKNKNSLVMICKDCDSDKKKALTTILFNLTTQTFSEGFSISTKPIAKALGEEKVKFKPSAANINPINGKLYLVSAVNNVLVEATTDGEVLEVYKLSKALFKQPEGITFSPQGDMMISNEAADNGVGNILFYNYSVSDNSTNKKSK